MANFGADLPIEISLMTPFVGGHGSVNSLPIVMAFHVPGGKTQTLPRWVQISDIAPTVASLLHLEVLSETVGEDLPGAKHCLLPKKAVSVDVKKWP